MGWPMAGYFGKGTLVFLLNLPESPLLCMGMNGSPEQSEGKSFF
jgi:hypothetical protein